MSVVVNVCGLSYFLRSELHGPNSKQLRSWLANNSTSTAGLVFLSATNLGVVRGMTAKLFNLGMFNAPLSPQGLVLASSIGLVSNISEDLPQLIIQATYVALSKGPTLVTVLSLTVTLFAFLSAVMSRLLKLLVIGDVDNDDEGDSHAHAGESSSNPSDSRSTATTSSVVESYYSEGSGESASVGKYAASDNSGDVEGGNGDVGNGSEGGLSDSDSDAYYYYSSS